MLVLSIKGRVEMFEFIAGEDVRNGFVEERVVERTSSQARNSRYRETIHLWRDFSKSIFAKFVQVFWDDLSLIWSQVIFFLISVHVCVF